MGVNKQKKPTPNERWGNLIGGRLTDKQIFDLFDEFGMAKRLQTKQDYEWAKHNLPNVPEELKKILKIELDKENHARKTEFEKLKEKAKEQKLAAKEASMAQRPEEQSSKSQGGDASNGQGGTSTSGWGSQATNTVRSDTPTATLSPASGWGTPATNTIRTDTPTTATPPTSGWGTQAANTTRSSEPSVQTDQYITFLKFPDKGATVWLADERTKELKPIMSMQAFQDLYTDGSGVVNQKAFQDAINSIVELNDETFSTSEWKDYNPLSSKYGIYEGGKTLNNLGFTTADVQSAYGKTQSDDANKAGLDSLTSFFTLLSQPNSGISNTFLNKVKNDKNLMAFWWTALAYGDYTNDDIYKDIKRRELIDQGQKELNNVNVISSTINADDYIITDPGRLATSLPSLEPPAEIGNISRELWRTKAASLSQEYYNLADPEKYDPTSSSFKDEVAKMKIEAYDYYEKELNAETNEEKAAIDSEWKQYVKDVYRTTGYQLGDNALAAWRQLEKIDKEYEKAGLGQSGIENEATDDALRDYREQNKQIRESRESTLQTKEEAMARASYSPAQIQALNDEDAAKGLPRSQWRTVIWGLTPLEKMTPEKFIAEHRANYPNTTLSDAEIKAQFYDNIYDENGNRRSNLYQAQQDKLSQEKYGRAIGDAFGTDYESAKTGLKIQKQLDEEAALQKDFTEGDLSSGKAFDKESAIDYSDPNAKGPSEIHALEATYPDTKTTDESGTIVEGAINTTGRDVTEYDPKTGNTRVVKLGQKFTPGWKFASGEAATAGKKQILDSASLAKYKPTDWYKDKGNIYLKDTAKPIEGTYKITSGAVSAPTPATNTVYKAPTPVKTPVITPTKVPVSATTSGWGSQATNTVRTDMPTTPTEIKITDPKYLSKYKESDLNRVGSNIYLKPGVAKLW